MALAPERYELYIAVVRAIADDLRPLQSTDALVRAYGDREEFLASASSRLGEGADPQLVVDAAFGLRFREVAQHSRRAEVRRRIAEADTDWVVLSERGATALELHVPTGTGLHSWVEEDVDTGRPRYGVQVLRLDPESGEPVGDIAPEPPLMFDEPAQWEQARADVRGRVSGTGEGDHD